MSYEKSPQAHLVAANCVCCHRTLVDSASVEAGMGPTCRAKHGYNDNAETTVELMARAANLLGEAISDPRMTVNSLVWRLSVGKVDVAKAVRAIDLLGFHKLARHLAEKLAAPITVKSDGEKLIVEAPFSESFNALRRNIRGAGWQQATKRHLVPMDQKDALWFAIKAAFPGHLVIGDKGIAVA